MGDSFEMPSKKAQQRLLAQRDAGFSAAAETVVHSIACIE